MAPPLLDSVSRLTHELRRHDFDRSGTVSKADFMGALMVLGGELSQVETLCRTFCSPADSAQIRYLDFLNHLSAAADETKPVPRFDLAKDLQRLDQNSASPAPRPSGIYQDPHQGFAQTAANLWRNSAEPSPTQRSGYTSRPISVSPPGDDFLDRVVGRVASLGGSSADRKGSSSVHRDESHSPQQSSEHTFRYAPTRVTTTGQSSASLGRNSISPNPITPHPQSLPNTGTSNHPAAGSSTASTSRVPLRDVFQILDTDGDGMVNSKDVANGFVSHGVPTHFHEVDVLFELLIDPSTAKSKHPPAMRFTEFCTFVSRLRPELIQVIRSVETWPELSAQVPPWKEGYQQGKSLNPAGALNPAGPANRPSASSPNPHGDWGVGSPTLQQERAKLEAEIRPALDSAMGTLGLPRRHLSTTQPSDLRNRMNGQRGEPVESSRGDGLEQKSPNVVQTVRKARNVATAPSQPGSPAPLMSFMNPTKSSHRREMNTQKETEAKGKRRETDSGHLGLNRTPSKHGRTPSQSSQASSRTSSRASSAATTSTASSRSRSFASTTTQSAASTGIGGAEKGAGGARGRMSAKGSDNGHVSSTPMVHKVTLRTPFNSVTTRKDLHPQRSGNGVQIRPSSAQIVSSPNFLGPKIEKRTSTGDSEGGAGRSPIGAAMPLQYGEPEIYREENRRSAFSAPEEYRSQRGTHSGLTRPPGLYQSRDLQPSLSHSPNERTRGALIYSVLQRFAGKESQLLALSSSVDRKKAGHLPKQQLIIVVRTIDSSLTPADLEDFFEAVKCNRTGDGGESYDYVGIVGSIIASEVPSDQTSASSPPSRFGVSEAPRTARSGQTSGIAFHGLSSVGRSPSGSPSPHERWGARSQVASSATASRQNEANEGSTLALLRGRSSHTPGRAGSVGGSSQEPERLNEVLRRELLAAAGSNPRTLLEQFFIQDTKQNGYLPAQVFRRTLQQCFNARQLSIPSALLDRCVKIARTPFQPPQQGTVPSSIERQARNLASQLKLGARQVEEEWCDYRYLMHSLGLQL